MTAFRNSAIATLLLLAGQSGSAATLNQVGLYQGSAGVGGCGTAPSATYAGETTIEANLNDGSLSCTMSMDGYAGGGTVGLRGTLNQTPGTESVNQVRARAVTNMSDIRIEPAAGYDKIGLEATYGPTIPITVNAAIDGTLTAIIDTEARYSRGASTYLNAYVYMSGLVNVSNPSSTRLLYVNDVGVTNSPGLSSDADNFYELIQPTITHNWTYPFRVEFGMGTSAGVSGYRDSFGTATFDAFNSLSFAKDGPAFILPDGFTVNAPELNIVNNRWIDPRTGGPGVSPVPLPASFWLLSAGLGILVAQRRRRKNSAKASRL